MVAGGIKEHTRQCLANLKALLEEAGRSLEKVVWANWSLREPTDFEIFNEEWVAGFPADGPVGQSTLMPPLQRRAGFRGHARGDRRGLRPRGPRRDVDRRVEGAAEPVAVSACSARRTMAMGEHAPPRPAP